MRMTMILDVVRCLLNRKANGWFPTPYKKGINSQIAVSLVWEANKNKKEKNNEKRSSND